MIGVAERVARERGETIGQVDITNVVVCCSVVQCGAVWCNVVQCGAM